MAPKSLPSGKARAFGSRFSLSKVVVVLFMFCVTIESRSVWKKELCALGTTLGCRGSKYSCSINLGVLPNGAEAYCHYIKDGYFGITWPEASNPNYTCPYPVDQRTNRAGLGFCLWTFDKLEDMKDIEAHCGNLEVISYSYRFGEGGDDDCRTAPMVTLSSNITFVGVRKDKTIQFKGIPYARKTERWTAPLPFDQQGVFPAKKYEAACPQKLWEHRWFPEITKLKMDEDCLYLNVFSPAEGEAPPSGRPVLVWIHGGGFTMGAPQQPSDDPIKLTNGLDAVFVSIAYRLGPLGFLALKELAREPNSNNVTGLYGIQDQQLALEWVVQNIQSFGGDPDKITLYGESAGGTSVCIHMALNSPTVRFQNAYISSAACTRDQFIPEEEALCRGRQLASILDCDPTQNQADCLRRLSWEEIYSPKVGDEPNLAFDDLSIWYPTFWKSWWLNNGISSWQRVWKSGSFLPAKVMIGSNRDEAALIYRILTPAIKESNIRGLNGANCMVQCWVGGDYCSTCLNDLKNGKKLFRRDKDDECPSRSLPSVSKKQVLWLLKKYYRQDHRSVYSKVIQMMSDAWLGCKVHETAELMSQFTSVYLYHFEERPWQQDSGDHKDYLSAHGTDLSFSFQNAIWLWDFPKPYFPRSQKNLANEMENTLQHFMKYGFPQSHWPAWNRYNPKWLIWNDKSNRCHKRCRKRQGGYCQRRCSRIAPSWSRQCPSVMNVFPQLEEEDSTG